LQLPGSAAVSPALGLRAGCPRYYRQSDGPSGGSTRQHRTSRPRCRRRANHVGTARPDVRPAVHETRAAGTMIEACVDTEGRNDYQCPILIRGASTNCASYSLPPAFFRRPGGCSKSQFYSTLRTLIIVSTTSDQVRNTFLLVGGAHRTKASIPARSQACEKASTKVRPAEDETGPAGMTSEAYIESPWGGGLRALRFPFGMLGFGELPVWASRTSRE